MNSSKRKRHSLYFWVDIFFLILPLVFIVGYFAFLFISFSLANKELFSSLYNSSQDFDSIFDYLYRFSSEGFYSSFAEDDGFIINAMDYISTYFFSWNSEGIFFRIVLNFLTNIFDFLGFNTYTLNGLYNFYGFILNYITYMICYEFLSFFIQIVLWIPRYFKNKLYDRGLME